VFRSGTTAEKVQKWRRRKKLCTVESNVLQLHNGENVDQRGAHKLLEDLPNQGKAQADERLNLRLSVIEEQVRSERQRIEREFEEAQRALHQRIFPGYCQIYATLKGQLKELMGKKYGAYLAANSIDFSRMPPETQMKRRLHEPEEAKVRLFASEAERDLRHIQEKYGQIHEPF
jgi:DTW domain-containing protein YfiP